MRRILAVLMLLVFGSFVSAPLLAASSDPQSALAACCRRNGKHHCIQAMDQNGAGASNAFVAPPCPFFPQTWLATDVQHHALEASPAGIFYASLQSHPACHAQLEAQGRISFDRSRQKRGPPAAVSVS